MLSQLCAKAGQTDNCNMNNIVAVHLEVCTILLLCQTVYYSPEISKLLVCSMASQSLTQCMNCCNLLVWQDKLWIYKINLAIQAECAVQLQVCACYWKNKIGKGLPKHKDTLCDTDKEFHTLITFTWARNFACSEPVRGLSGKRFRAIRATNSTGKEWTKFIDSYTKTIARQRTTIIYARIPRPCDLLLISEAHHINNCML